MVVLPTTENMELPGPFVETQIAEPRPWSSDS